MQRRSGSPADSRTTAGARPAPAARLQELGIPPRYLLFTGNLESARALLADAAQAYRDAVATQHARGVGSLPGLDGDVVAVPLMSELVGRETAIRRDRRASRR